MKRLLTLICGCALLLSACSKNTATPDNGNKQDTTQTPTKPSKELMVGTWVFVSVISDDPDNPTPLDPCAADDLTTFNADGTWMPDHNGTICDTNTTNVPGTWNIDNYPVFVLKHPYWIYKSENKIIQLDATTLKYERRYPDINEHVFTFTMKRK